MWQSGSDRGVVGRQRIVDRESTVVGYELLTGTVDAAFVDGDGPGLTPGAVWGALDQLVGDRPVFWPARELLGSEGAPRPERVVVQVDEALAGDPAAVAGCLALAGAGYPLALAGFPWAAPDPQLLAAAAIVQVELPRVAPDALPGLVDRLQHPGRRLLAAGVSDAAALAEAQRLGFDLFQGCALERLPGEPQREPGPSELARARMSAALLHNPLDFDEIEDMLRTEPGLTYQIIELASIGRLGDTARQVSSLRRALVLVGSWRVQNWMVMLLARPQDQRNDGAMTGALARARACELLARDLGRNEARLGFTAGMISSFEQLTQVPRAELERSLALSEELREAAFGGDGPLGRIVSDVADRQDGAEPAAPRSGRTPDEIAAGLAGGYAWAVRAGAAVEAGRAG